MIGKKTSPIFDINSIDDIYLLKRISPGSEFGLFLYADVSSATGIVTVSREIKFTIEEIASLLEARKKKEI